MEPKQFPEPAEAPSPVPNEPEPIPGWPGYRTRPGRTGLDYIDTNTELSHMEGVFVRNLLDGKLKTTDPYRLRIIRLFLLAISLPFVVIIVQLLVGSSSPFLVGLILLVYALLAGWILLASGDRD